MNFGNLTIYATDEYYSTYPTKSALLALSDILTVDLPFLGLFPTYGTDIETSIGGGGILQARTLRQKKIKVEIDPKQFPSTSTNFQDYYGFYDLLQMKNLFISYDTTAYNFDLFPKGTGSISTLTIPVVLTSTSVDGENFKKQSIEFTIPHNNV